MESMLLGYFPKRTMMRPEWLKAPQVKEICSVSKCMSKGPDDWINVWRHNEFWLFDTPDLAWSVVSDEHRKSFDLYAFRKFAVEFRDGVPSPIELPESTAVPVDQNFQQMGFDVVSSYTGNEFEHSPLSCNGFAETVPTNQYCLLDTVDAAIEFAKKCEHEGSEPGPYYAIQVFRRKRQGNRTR